MKKLFQFATLSLLALAGCIREEAFRTEIPRMTISVDIPEETKAAFSVPESGSGLHLAWQAGDQIRVFNHDNPAQNAVYYIQDGFDDHHAQFSGEVVPGSHFDIVCPGTYTSTEAAAQGNAALTQNGNGSTDHLVFTALLENVSKDDLPEIVFSDAWVAEHAGTSLKKGSIVKFVLTLPAAVTAPKKVQLKGIGPEVSVNLSNVSLASEHVLTAYAQGSWDDVDIPASTKFTVGVTDGDGSYYTATNTIASANTLRGGAQNSIRINNENSFVEHLFAGGSGTPEDPWLLANAKHLGNIYDALEEWQKKYFLLVNDIDMEDWLSSHTWKPLNNSDSYKKPIHLDGGGYSINHFKINKTDNTNNHCGFFGVLYGEVCNLNFTNAEILNSYNVATGILASFCGYTSNKQAAHVYNVHVQGTVIFTGTSNNPVGGMAGRLDNAVVESCSADIHVWSDRNDVGGLFGIDYGATPSTPSIIRNCWTTGTVRGRQRTGGIAGNLGGTGTSNAVKGTQIINSFSTVEFDKSKWNNADKETAQGGDRAVGGIVGFAALGHTGDNGAGARDEYPDNRISGCIAWQTHVGQTATGNSYPAGAIVGYTSIHNYLENCWRNPNMILSSLANNVTLEDQEDASPTVDLVVTNPAPSSYPYIYPYHGKAAASGKTLSQVASEAGWSHIAWDLSGSVPVLTGVLDSGEVPASGAGSLPVPDGHSTAPKHPTESGSWVVVEEVAPGITYYHYDNPDDATYTTSEVAKFYDENQKKNVTYFDGSSNNKTHQNVFVVDVDLNNPAYEVKILRTGGTAIPTSQIFDEINALVAINGGYERENIFEKDNVYYYPDKHQWVDYPAGYAASNLPNDMIEDGLPNWKSQATLYCDGHRGVRIAFDGYDPDKAASSVNPPLKSAAEMRYFYQYVADSPGILSSAPMLIDNYNQVGATFHSTWYPGSSSHLYDGTLAAESPYRHQRSLYPRTAVALTSDNHLLLFVCDGRYKKTEGGTGMSSGWVAKFLHDNFNPQYAINLDGGGSTTMCVRGASDASVTGVVNYPNENYTGKSGESGVVDQEGERARNCFVVIVPKK